MNKVLYYFERSKYSAPKSEIKECEVVKETDKQYKVKVNYGCRTMNKSEMSVWDYAFYETKEEAIRGLNDYCVSMIAKKNDEIERAQKRIAECKEVIKELWK